MTDRCEDGRLMRHSPGPDDPYCEIHVGKCPECGGKGCDPNDLVTRLRGLAQSEHDDISIADEAADEIERLAKIATDAHDKWEVCLKEIERQKEHIAGLQAALRSANAETQQ